MKARDLLDALASVDPDAPVAFVFHQPRACCDDPADVDTDGVPHRLGGSLPDRRHHHDVPDIPCADVDPVRDMIVDRNLIIIKTRGEGTP